MLLEIAKQAILRTSCDLIRHKSMNQLSYYVIPRAPIGHRELKREWLANRLIVRSCFHAALVALLNKELRQYFGTIKQQKCMAWLKLTLRGGTLCHVTWHYILWQHTIICSNTYVLVEVCNGNRYQTDDRGKTDCTKIDQHSNIGRPPRRRRKFSRDWTSHGKLSRSRDRRREDQAWESPSLPSQWSSNIPVSAEVQLILLV